VVTGNRYEDMATYSCIEGYEITNTTLNSTTITCQSDKTWSILQSCTSEYVTSCYANRLSFQKPKRALNSQSGYNVTIYGKVYLNVIFFVMSATQNICINHCYNSTNISNMIQLIDFLCRD